MPDFDAIDVIAINGVGENVSFTPFGGSLVVITALFQAPDEATDGGDIPIEAVAPMVTVKNTDATAPDKRDLFTIRGVAYTVKRIEQDEGALVVYHLLEV